jgi:2-phosphosulfolactate phosphatase
MEIRIESLLEGARRAAGTVVVIDVFRAFTTAAVALARGAEKIILTAEPAEALALRAAGLGELCLGEVGGVRPPGFDFGNSPFELGQADVRGKTLIQSTRAGTVGVCAVPQPAALYAASFVTAGATVRAILREGPPLVTLVAMGARPTQRSDEDEQCALYLRNRLLGRAPDPDAVRRLVADSADAARFGNPELPHFHPGDLALALDMDRYDFAVRVTYEDGRPVARALAGG